MPRRNSDICCFSLAAGIGTWLNMAKVRNSKLNYAVKTQIYIVVVLQVPWCSRNKHPRMCVYIYIVMYIDMCNCVNMLMFVWYIVMANNQQGEFAALEGSRHQQTWRFTAGRLRPKSPLQIPTFLSWSEDDDSKQWLGFLRVLRWGESAWLWSQGRAPKDLECTGHPLILWLSFQKTSEVATFAQSTRFATNAPIGRG